MDKSLIKTIMAIGALVVGLQSAVAADSAACSADVPIAKHTYGADDIAVSGDSLAIDLTGKIVKRKNANAGNKGPVRVCEGSMIKYDAVSKAGDSVSCRINGVHVPSKGLLRADQGSYRLVCSDRSAGGNDIDHVRIVSAK